MENANLSNLDLKTVLKSSYGLNVDNIEKMKHSSTDCYVITCGEKKYFVKVFNKYKNISKIEQENEILKNLKREGFRVPNIIKTNEEGIYTFYNDHYLFLERYIEGYSCAEIDISDDILLTSSELLGKMHSVLNDKYDDKNKIIFWQNLNIENERQFLNSVLDLMKIEPEDSNYKLIREAIEHKKYMLTELRKMNAMFDGMTYLMTHGDYSKRNLLYDNEKNITIVDFSDSGVYPASWELIRSYFFSTESCKNGKKFDYDLFYKYVEKYLKKFNLNKKDIELMPYLFMYQILISRYGYKEYLQNRDEKLIEFIEWKENITYFLEKNADTIVKKLKL